MNKFRMRTKLSVGFGLMLLLACLIGGTSIYEMRRFNQQAHLVKSGLMPQMEFAVTIDQQMRTAGLGMRRFVSNGSQADLQIGLTALAEVKAAMSKATALEKVPGLTVIRTFLRDVPEELRRFEQACTAIQQAMTATDKAITVIRAEGPATTNELTILMAQAHKDLRAAAVKGDSAEIDLILGFLNQYNALYDNVETLNRAITTAFADKDRAKLDKALQDSSVMLNEFDKLYSELKQIPEVSGKIETAKAAFYKFNAATRSLAEAEDTLTTTEAAMVDSYQSTLNQVKVLVSRSVNTNNAIADQMVSAAGTAVSSTSMALGVALLVGLGMTVLLTRNITGQLSQFVDAAMRLSNGDFDTRVPVTSGDEIGMTATRINTAFDVVVDKIHWYEAILDAIPSPITVTDLDRKWTFINKATESALNRTRQDVVGRSCKEWGTTLCGNDTCPIECLQHGGLMNHKLRHLGKDYSITVSYICNRHGEKIGHIELLTDVTGLVDAQLRAETALSDGMHEAVAQLEGVMGQVGGFIGDLSGFITHAANGSVEQAARMTETADSMSRMNVTVSNVAQNASSADQISTTARKKAEDGAVTVREAVNGIRAVRRDSLVLKEDMATLSEHAQAISRIMGVISDIADQTNLLALNAAIEAARAGDAGRGFAVVADEVRKLAEKTMASTMDVSNAIQAIQQSTEKSTQQVDVAVAGIEEATTLAERSGEALAEIVLMVDNAVEQVRVISTASQEQSEASVEINRSITLVNSIAADTAHSMREASDKVDSLLNMNAKISHVMDEMRNK